MERTIVIGDIHGCLDELKLLLKEIAFSKERDRLISVGDLVDRGPDSPGVIRYLISQNAECVQGNHDTKLLRYAKHVERAKHNKNYRNPMLKSEEREAIVAAMTDKELNWLSNLPYYIRLPEFNAVVVHAGVLSGRPIEQQTKEVLTMVRYVEPNPPHRMLSLVMPGFNRPENSVYWPSLYYGSENIIFGHNVMDLTNPTIFDCPGGAKAFGIDTGACFGGRLTCMIFDNVSGQYTFESIQSNKVYEHFESIK